MTEKDKEESILSKFSNQDPASGGYGEEEDAERKSLVRGTPSASEKAKKKKKNKAAKKSRKKNRK